MIVRQGSFLELYYHAPQNPGLVFMALTLHTLTSKGCLFGVFRTRHIMFELLHR